MGEVVRVALFSVWTVRRVSNPILILFEFCYSMTVAAKVAYCVHDSGWHFRLLLQKMPYFGLWNYGQEPVDLILPF